MTAMAQLLVFASIVLAGAVFQAADKTCTAKKKCKISWTDGKGYKNSVSFGVSNCVIGCKITNGDNRHEKVFPRFGFKDVTPVDTKGCKCNRQGFTAWFPPGGQHSCKTDGPQLCYNMWLRMRTDENTPNRPTVHHTELFKDAMFTYHTSECAASACEGSNCDDTDLASVDEGLSEEWIQAVSEGKYNKKDDVQVAIAEALEYKRGWKSLTVTEFRAKYLKLLEGTHINVDVLMKAADIGLDDRTALVTKEQYQKFLSKEQYERSRVHSSKYTSSTKVTTSSTNHSSTVSQNSSSQLWKGLTVAQFRATYVKLLEGTNIDVNALMKIAGISLSPATLASLMTQERYEKFISPAC